MCMGHMNHSASISALCMPARPAYSTFSSTACVCTCCPTLLCRSNYQGLLRKYSIDAAGLPWYAAGLFSLSGRAVQSLWGNQSRRSSLACCSVAVSIHDVLQPCAPMHAHIDTNICPYKYQCHVMRTSTHACAQIRTPHTCMHTLNTPPITTVTARTKHVCRNNDEDTANLIGNLREGTYKVSAGWCTKAQRKHVPQKLRLGGSSTRSSAEGCGPPLKGHDTHGVQGHPHHLAGALMSQPCPHPRARCPAALAPPSSGAGA